MAIYFSENEVNYARKKYYGKFYIIKNNLNLISKLINKILIFFYNAKFSLINLKRKIYRIKYFFYFRKKPLSKFEKFSINLDENSIEKISNNLKLNNFAFIENFLTTDSYNYLVNNWPNINLFNHNKNILKHYSRGFIYSSGISKNIENYSDFKYSAELKKFYEFLISKEFKNFYSKLVKFKKFDFFMHAISSTMATKNSYLIPHVDGISDTPTQMPYNFIYFLDGYEEDPINGGATGIYKDNEFKSAIFIPKTIKNSVLIYNQSEKFYHGFRSINSPSNIYRKTINFKIKPNNF